MIVVAIYTITTSEGQMAKRKSVSIAGVQYLELPTSALRADHRSVITLAAGAPSYIGTLPVVETDEPHVYAVQGEQACRRFLSAVGHGQAKFACEVIPSK
jgi:hypothetical protein